MRKADRVATMTPPVPSASAGPPGDGQASQRRLIWRRFRRHRVAMVSLCVLAVAYLVAILSPFVAPSSAGAYDADYAYAPPQRVHVLDDGRLGLYVYGYRSETDPVSLARTFTVDESRKIPLGFFVRGEPYSLFGFESDVHLFGPQRVGDPFYLMGANSQGQDVFSRTLHAARISMSVGLVGVFLSFVLGVLIGGVSGFFAGRVDTVIQRLIEFIIAVPAIPLWMGLSAALPPGWSTLQIYFGITIILSLIGWTGLARVVRGQFLSLREEEFTVAARLDGVGRLRIIVRHLLPSCAGYIIAALTLAIPGMILGETTLSFLGLGMQPPAVSWGVLLQEGQNLRALSSAPWLLFPGLAVVLVVLAFNFLGDGLRDAADPYER
jgi:peptide/nickel transport system permease protein